MKEKYIRQNFLGNLSQLQIETVKIAIIGYGGGGSHIGQQLLHIGFKNIKVFEDDVVEESNTHRLVGIHYPSDVLGKIPKIEIAKRMAINIQGNNNLKTFNTKWQLNSDELLECQIVVGCVDSFDERDQLENFCRRHLIAYIDIGMGVQIRPDEPPQMGGQVIMSRPGGPCMRCLGFLTEEKLNDDRSRYGDAGPQPQVIWSNGVLASTAVGIIVDIVTGWSGQNLKTVYLSYDGNTGHVMTHPRLTYLKNPVCAHYPLRLIGAPRIIQV